MAQRHALAPKWNPAPTAASVTRLSLASSPLPQASHRAMGTEAAPVLPMSCTLVKVRLSSIFILRTRYSIRRRLAW